MQAPQLEHSIPPRQDRTARRGSPQLTDAVADDNGWSDSERFYYFSVFTSFTGEALRQSTKDVFRLPANTLQCAPAPSCSIRSASSCSAAAWLRSTHTLRPSDSLCFQS